jgi:metal-dependent amidase/aminoacylase/carboxypeptidase family protein
MTGTTTSPTKQEATPLKGTIKTQKRNQRKAAARRRLAIAKAKAEMDKLRNSLAKQLATESPELQQQIRVAGQEAANAFSHSLAPTFLVSEIRDIQFVWKAGHVPHVVCDTRYTGYEAEENWQPLKNVENTEALAKFMAKVVKDKTHPIYGLLAEMEP